MQEDDKDNGKKKGKKKKLPGLTEAPKEHPDNITGNMKIIME